VGSGAINLNVINPKLTYIAGNLVRAGRDRIADRDIIGRVGAVSIAALFNRRVLQVIGNDPIRKDFIGSINLTSGRIEDAQGLHDVFQADKTILRVGNQSFGSLFSKTIQEIHHEQV